ncbi:MAG: enoyl-CoA hydratase [Thermoleophilaceae bacterium]|jgi:enoyl-CoA hydratase|nr:enoyl-CoA hydratase [Thermoleophilaceae bacterium]
MAEIEVTVAGGVATLRLAAPDRRNSLTPEMAVELIDACERIDADQEVGAVVVCGSGGYFCAGAHRDALADAGLDPAGDEAFEKMGSIYRSFARVGELATPTIAAVVGGAVGAGVNLALACDLRIVATDATIVAGFMKLGIHPGGGHFTLVGRAGGREAAAAFGLFGEGVDGTRAAQVGLAWEALPADQVEPRALELAAVPGADPVLARKATHSMRQQLGPPGTSWPVALDAERAAQMWSLRRKSS